MTGSGFGITDLFFLSSGELERGRVDTVTEASRRRTVFKNMPKVGMTAGAVNFSPDAEKAAIFAGRDVIRPDGLVEAGPAGTRIVFGLRVEQAESAGDTVVGAISFMIPIGIIKGWLSALKPCDPVLLGRKQRFPCFLTLFNARERRVREGRSRRGMGRGTGHTAGAEGYLRT